MPFNLNKIKKGDFNSLPIGNIYCQALSLLSLAASAVYSTVTPVLV